MVLSPVCLHWDVHRNGRISVLVEQGRMHNAEVVLWGISAHLP